MKNKSEIKFEKQQLILLEKGINAHQWMEFARKVGSSEKTFVLTEKPVYLRKAQKLGFKIRAIDDYVLPSSALDGKLFSDTLDLLDTWMSQSIFPEYTQVLKHEGVSFGKTIRLIFVLKIFPILKKLEVIKRVLSSAQWKRVYLLINKNTLSTPFYLIAESEQFAGRVEEISMRESKNQMNVKRRVYQSMVAGWGDQLIYDYLDGFSLARLLKSVFPSKKDTDGLYLFILRDSGIYQSTILPIIRAINPSKKIIVLCENKVSGLNNLRAQGVEVSYWTEYVPVFAWPDIISQTIKLRNAWKRIQNDKQAQAVFSYGDYVSLWPAIRDQLEYLFLHYFPKIVLHAWALGHIMKSLQPEALVTVPDRGAIARIAILFAKRHHIPSLYVQPAMVSDHQRYGPLYADKVAVFDRYSRQIFLDRGGVSPERTVITGSPRSDRILDAISEATQQSTQIKVRENLGLNIKDKYVVLATQPLSQLYIKKMIKSVGRAVLSYPFLKLVIKIHPRESLAKYGAILSNLDRLSTDPIVVKNIDLYALLAGSELVISGFSNVILEAVLIARPTLVVNLTGESDPLPFVENGIALGAYSEVEVKRQFDRIMSDPSTRESLRMHRKHYLRRNPQLIDGQSTQRVVELLQQMVISNEAE